MLVSICIPTFNGSAYLAETLESALAQTYPDFEVLVVDDLSTDNTLEIANSYAALDTRIRVLQNSRNLGLVKNWNRCIELAKGEWIKFLFQDDLLTPDCLIKMINYQEKASGKEKVLFCKKDHIFENISSIRELNLKMNKIKFFWDLYPNKFHITPQETIKLMLKWPSRNIFGEPSSFLIHRDIFDKLGLFDDTLYHICDFEYWLRIGVNFPILMIPEILVHFRIHKNSTSNFNRQERWLQTRYLDKIRLHIKFLHNDSYATFRSVINTWPCNMYFKTLIAIYIRIAERAVKKEKNTEWDNEFTAFCEEYREMVDSSKANYLILIIRYGVSRCYFNAKWFISFLISKISLICKQVRAIATVAKDDDPI